MSTSGGSASPDSTSLSIEFWFPCSQELVQASADCLADPGVPHPVNLGTSASSRLYQISGALGTQGAAKGLHLNLQLDLDLDLHLPG